MPIKKCSTKGKKGKKYGERGKCYVGKDARARAAKQGRAMWARKASAKKS